MSAISPKVASDLALAVYAIKDLAKAKRLDIDDETDRNFSFSLNDVIKGTSGGYFWRPETGFVLLGKGRSQRYRNDHVIVIRGTDSLADALTDASSHTTTSDTGNSVHIGFQRTFDSIKPEMERYLRQHATKASGIIHCIGHSLGGALATLTANWISAHPAFKGKVYLYTFGAPRPGLRDFSISASSRIDNICRCVHGADPVPKVPVWPFYHTPHNGREYLLDNTQGINFSAHRMVSGPGYINTANRSSWDKLPCQTVANLHQRVVLNYQHRMQASYSTTWADKLSAALMTILVDGGCAATIATLQTIGASIGTIYDMMAKTLSDLVQVSQALADQVRGLLGHMLVFAGKGANVAIELTEKFIRWVFKVTIGRLNSAARQALKSN